MALSPAELRDLQLKIERYLAGIEKLFKPDVKITLIVRFPGKDDADVLLTRDSKQEVIKVIERRFE